MRARAYGFLTACVVLFVSTSVWSQDKKDDQPGTLTVHIRDYCDPASFAAIGCTRAVTPVTSGIITFSGFQAELTADKSVGAWRFIPDSANTQEGVQLMLQNLGGETHTFTRVKKFGGGFVPALNAASGNPTPAPECLKPPSADNVFVPANSNVNGPQVREGDTANFQCCIHPWMRTVINTKEHEQQDSGHDH